MAMGDDNVVLFKSKQFGVRILNLARHLYKDDKYLLPIIQQFLRSGTSIGANVHESIYGSSRKDFLNKLYISLKECSETKYWLELLFETNHISERQFTSIHDDCVELLRLLTSITKTLKE